MKIKKCQRVAVLLAVTLFSVFMGACSDESGSTGHGSGETNAASEFQTSHKDDVRANGVNPIGISSSLYEYCDKKITIDKAGNVKLLATLAPDMIEDVEEIVGLWIHNYDGSRILVEYEDTIENVSKKHLAMYDKTTGKLIKELVFDTLGGVFIEKKRNSISVETMENEIWITRTYDFELNPIAQMSYEKDIFPGVETDDGKKFYYSQNGKLYAYDSDNDVNIEFELQDKCLVEGVNGVITDQDGNDYVVFVGMAADYNIYNFIYDIANSDIVRVDKEAYDFTGNTLAIYGMTEGVDSINSYIIGYSKEKAFKYEVENGCNGVTYLVLDNGNLLFTYSENDSVYIDIYDKNTGKLKASTVIDVSKIRRELNVELTEDDEMFYFEEFTMYDTPILISKDTLLFELVDYYGTIYYLEWKLDEPTKEGMMKVTSHKNGSIESVDISKFKNDILIPGKLNDSLKPLRGEADRLEEEYDIEIHIGEECSDISGSFLVYPLTDYKTVEETLELLKAELKKYPKDFFKNFKYDEIKGLDVHIASELKGISEDNMSTAGGFKTIEDYYIKLVVDCNNPGNIQSTFHHELSHAIEEVIFASYMDEEGLLLDEEKWNSLNIYDDMYSGTYHDWGKEEYWEHTYENLLWSEDGDISDAYFLDNYAMTYPTEDRARIFQCIMSDKLYDIDFDETPYLKEKLNYYAECIRYAFDSSDWKDVPWEEYME